MPYKCTIEADEQGSPNLLVITLAPGAVTFMEAATNGPPTFESLCAVYEALSVALNAAIYQPNEQIEYDAGHGWRQGMFLRMSGTKVVIRGYLGDTKELPWGSVRKKQQREKISEST